jgi:sulfonate transport system substrate-binding protein
VFHPDVKEHYRAVAAYALARGLIRRPVDVDTLLDERFVAQALKDQNLQANWSTAAERPRAAQALAASR